MSRQHHIHNPQFPADLVTFNEEILNAKLHFLLLQVYFSKAQSISKSLQLRKINMKTGFTEAYSRP